MGTAILSLKTTQINWPDVIEYPQSGVKSKLLLEDENCRYALMSLGAPASIAEHTNPRNATVNVIEGQGVLTLEGKEIVLELGVFVFISRWLELNVRCRGSLSALQCQLHYALS